MRCAQHAKHTKQVHDEACRLSPVSLHLLCTCSLTCHAGGTYSWTVGCNTSGATYHMSTASLSMKTSNFDKHCRQGQGTLDTAAVAAWRQSTFALWQHVPGECTHKKQRKRRSCLAAEASHISTNQPDTYVPFSRQCCCSCCGWFSMADLMTTLGTSRL